MAARPGPNYRRRSASVDETIERDKVCKRMPHMFTPTFLYNASHYLSSYSYNGRLFLDRMDSSTILITTIIQRKRDNVPGVLRLAQSPLRDIVAIPLVVIR